MLVWIVFIRDTFMNLLNRRKTRAFFALRLGIQCSLFWFFFFMLSSFLATNKFVWKWCEIFSHRWFIPLRNDFFLIPNFPDSDTSVQALSLWTNDIKGINFAPHNPFFGYFFFLNKTKHNRWLCTSLRSNISSSKMKKKKKKCNKCFVLKFQYKTVDKNHLFTVNHFRFLLTYVFVILTRNSIEFWCHWARKRERKIEENFQLTYVSILSVCYREIIDRRRTTTTTTM